MEELHRIHKDTPFGYWVDLVLPVYRALKRRRREWPAPAAAERKGHDRLIALR